MRFSDNGRAFAHVLLPIGSLNDEIVALEAELARTSLASEPEFSHVAGSSDILIRLRITSFRNVFKLNALLGKSANRLTWIFSVPYEGMVGRETTANREEEHTAEPVRRVVIHFRVLRFIYREGAISSERDILGRIREVVGDYPFTGELSAGIGWSDIILDGEFRGSIDRIIHLIMRLRNLYIPVAGVDRRVFSRTLSIVGNHRLPTEGLLDEPAPAPAPLLLVRSKPGRFRETIETLKAILRELTHERDDGIKGGKHSERRKGGNTFNLWVTEGKWDIMIAPAGKEVRVRDFHNFSAKQLRIIQRKCVAAGIERVQTNLCLVSADDILRELDQLRLPATPECRCAKLILQSEGLQQATYELLPNGLRDSLANTLALFRYALRDRDNCCDIRPTLLAADGHLRGLLERLEIVAERRAKAEEDYRKDTTDENRRAIGSWQDWVEWYLRRLVDWCELAQPLLGERTSGSLEELFTQTSSLASHRGSVQKYLFIVDALLREFFGEAAAGLAENTMSPVVLYGNEDIIRSIPAAGFIFVPVRYLFALPLQVPQLWHETAQLMFRSIYRVAATTNDSARGFARLQQRLGTLKKGIESGNVACEELLNDVGDKFADLVVFHRGFDGDFSEFLTYLATLTLSSHLFRSAPLTIRERLLIRLAERLLYVYEFLHLAEARIFMKAPNWSLQARKSLVLQLPSSREELQPVRRREYLSNLAHELNDHLLEEVFAMPQYAHFKIGNSAEIVGVALENSLTDIHIDFRWSFLWDYMEDLEEAGVLEVSKDALDEGKVTAIVTGAPVDFGQGESVTRYYRWLYFQEAKRRLRQPGSTDETVDDGVASTAAGGPVVGKEGRMTPAMAALAKSALIAFYRRDGTA